MFVQNVIKDSTRYGNEKLNIKDVEICCIYHSSKKNTTKFYWIKSNQSFENILSTQFTTVHIKQTKSVT